MQKFDITIKSEIITSDKPSKGLEAHPAPNAHTMNRIKGYLQDGTCVYVALRQGKGGMDFNKVMGGKIYAVAADAFSPVYEKEEGKKTQTQKTEDGLPLYSSSGLYQISSKEYPSLLSYKAMTRLSPDGSFLYTIKEQPLIKEFKGKSVEFEMIEADILEMLDEKHNLAVAYNEDVNKKRKRGINSAVEEAEDNNEEYSGAKYTDLVVSPKDGAPFVLLLVKTSATEVAQFLITKRVVETDPKNADNTFVKMLNAQEAVLAFKASKQYAKLLMALENPCRVKIIQGFGLRTSVSFKTKIDNTKNSAGDFGAAVYIQSALQAWTKGICTMMYSKHPAFPQQDYEYNNYVVAAQQLELGMNRVGPKPVDKNTKQQWSTPQAIAYNSLDLFDEVYKSS